MEGSLVLDDPVTYSGHLSEVNRVEWRLTFQWGRRFRRIPHNTIAFCSLSATIGH